MIGNISTNGLTPVLLAKKMRIDYERDVQIVAQLADVPVFFLATTTNFPPKTFAEFLAYAKANPGKVRYGSAGIGSYQQINTEILAKRAGLDLVHIPFKGGGAEIIRDLANGDIHVSWFNITNPVGMMKAGRVRALAIAAEQRLAQYPDVPTLQEVGYSRHARLAMGRRLCAGRGPADIVETLNRAFVKAMSTPEMQEAFERGGMVPPRTIRSKTPRTGCATKWRAGSATSRTSALSVEEETLKIGILLGDDIGLEVVPECVKVMKAAAARERPRDRVASAADRQGRARGARRYAAGGDRAGAARARRLDHGADRARRLSARRHDLGDAAGAQEVRAVRRGAALAVARHASVGPQERRHRVLPRAHRGHALFRDRGRRRCRSSARTTTSRSRCG